MDIDWDTPARLDSFVIKNVQGYTNPPPHDGTLRSCLEKVQEWPMTAVPTLHTEVAVQGRTIFNREEIGALLKLMRQD